MPHNPCPRKTCRHQPQQQSKKTSRRLLHCPAKPTRTTLHPHHQRSHRPCCRLMSAHHLQHYPAKAMGMKPHRRRHRQQCHRLCCQSTPLQQEVLRMTLHHIPCLKKCRLLRCQTKRMQMTLYLRHHQQCRHLCCQSKPLQHFLLRLKMTSHHLLCLMKCHNQPLPRPKKKLRHHLAQRRSCHRPHFQLISVQLLPLLPRMSCHLLCLKKCHNQPLLRLKKKLHHQAQRKSCHRLHFQLISVQLLLLLLRMPYHLLSQRKCHNQPLPRAKKKLRHHHSLKKSNHPLYFQMTPAQSLLLLRTSCHLLFLRKCHHQLLLLPKKISHHHPALRRSCRHLHFQKI